MANYKIPIPYIKKSEGGLSRALTDTASKNPSPYIYAGQTGWHTNKGITYTTFASLSTKLGYENNANNFLTMPDWIWEKIYKSAYWDPMAGDLYKSQAIANAVVDFAWASGTGGATAQLKKYLAQNGISASNATQIAQGFNALVSKKGEGNVFNSLIDFRKQFFISLNQPANTKAWLSRMETLRIEGMRYLGRKIKAHPYITAALSAIIIFSTYFLLSGNKKTKYANA